MFASVIWESQMKHAFARRLLGFAQVGTFVLISGVSFADDPTGHILVDRISVYYAVSPAKMIGRYPKGSPEFEMHGGSPGGKHIHHVMVALFDGCGSQGTRRSQGTRLGDRSGSDGRGA